MKQQPNTSKLKFKKNHRIKYKSVTFDKKNCFLIKGFYGLQAKNSVKMTYKQIETGRVVLRKYIKKKGIISINVFTWANFTKKSIGVRMGKGKGKPFK
jgi:large subunit ribosomal protein L16